MMSEDQKSEGAQSPSPQFDAFVSYHGPDREEVEWICEQLTARGVRLWVDYEQNMAGRLLREVLAEAIKASHIGVVILGTRGLGKWQAEELDTLLDFRTRGKITKLILVLLPGVAEVPDRLGLAGLVRIKFAESLDEPEVLDRVEEAITGKHPRTKWDVFEIHVEVPSLGEGCFVASPLERKDDRYQSIVRAVASTGMELLQFRRSDQSAFYTDVAKGILAAQIVVVDAAPDEETGIPAPEVLYEWGVADALGKPIIVLDNGNSALPIVATARRRLEYKDEELGTDGEFEKKLAGEIKRVTDALRYPYLTENDLDDVYSNRVRFMCLRPSVWQRFLIIILFGIRIHDRIREVAKHAHKLEQDIQRVFEDLEDIQQAHNSELHKRNWGVFRKTFTQEYLCAHASLHELFRRFRDREQDSVETAFGFLIELLPQPLVQLAEGSRGYYRRTLNRVNDYLANHEGLVHYMAETEGDGPEGAGFVKSLCALLSECVNDIDCQVSKMITTLLEVIAKEQKPIGGKLDVSRAS